MTALLILPKRERLAGPEEVVDLAKRIFAGLKMLSPMAFIQGHPNDGVTLIDGRFDLKRLAQMISADQAR